jgi:hypothetical protein
LWRATARRVAHEHGHYVATGYHGPANEMVWAKLYDHPVTAADRTEARVDRGCRRDRGSRGDQPNAVAGAPDLRGDFRDARYRRLCDGSGRFPRRPTVPRDPGRHRHVQCASARSQGPP